MPKKFSSETKTELKYQIMKIAKYYYLSDGLPGVEIRKIASEVNISTGMFYKLFPSKEDMFSELLKYELATGRENINQAVIAYRDHPKCALREYWYQIQKELYENPLLQRARVQDVAYLMAILQQHHENVNVNDSAAFIQSLCDYWLKNQLVQDEDIYIIMESVRAISMLWFHQKEIGAHYQLIVDRLLDQVTSSL
ncbi:TetR/AcrR family transcriptional regulator [Brassicibacter mesophilus]|uniref:TetR/AcrR family transcriptional regulator n=1 Tax=Brassicibacter mesophilus TaxID=745119 RepID=UPI003D20FB5D